MLQRCLVKGQTGKNNGIGWNWLHPPGIYLLWIVGVILMARRLKWAICPETKTLLTAFIRILLKYVYYSYRSNYPQILGWHNLLISVARTWFVSRMASVVKFSSSVACPELLVYLISNLYSYCFILRFPYVVPFCYWVQYVEYKVSYIYHISIIFSYFISLNA